MFVLLENSTRPLDCKCPIGDLTRSAAYRYKTPMSVSKAPADVSSAKSGEMMNEAETAESSPYERSAEINLKTLSHGEAVHAAPLQTSAACTRTNAQMDLKTLRVAEYAACQMLLDSLYSATAASGRDLESVWIMACVLHNTLRNLVTDPHISARYLNQEDVPEHIYMTMSRRAIADKTGLSRETVRRRTNKLIEDGVLIESNGNVRLGYRVRTRADIANINALHAAAAAFVKTINDHNARMPMDLPER